MPNIRASGWKLDSKGVLRDVPAAENPSEFPQKPMVDVYPVQEKVHILFVSRLCFLC